MEGESSYESDISESWSLIDININEESLSGCEKALETEKSHAAELENVNSKKGNELELKQITLECNEISETDFSPLSGSDSNSSFASEGLVNSGCNDLDEVHSPCNKSVEEDRKNDSDVESIEILDVDGNYRDSEVDRLESVTDSQDSQTYQSDDEESLEENGINGSTNNSSTVIKRKRKKCTKHSEGTVNIVNSENRCSEKSDSTAFTTDAVKENASEVLREGNSHAVYKHYRNNVANTVLSLSVGVIFAGVACMAIGHFLGVQDAAESAGELVETLKKLQVENAALQSRLFHLNRALLNREANSKLGLPPNRVSCKEMPEVLTSKTDETDLNRAALSEIRSSLNSIEWLSKLQNLVRNDNKGTENGIDFKGFGMYIHDQLNVLRTKKEGGIKLLEDADRKISKVLQKIVTRLSTSQENIENLYQRLINLKDKLNHKLSKILPDGQEDTGEDRKKFEKKTPVTEHDLQSIQWKSGEKEGKNYFGEHQEPIILYQFPQPEKYYQGEVKNLENIREKKVNITNSIETSKTDTFEKGEDPEKKEKKRCNFESENKKQKKCAKFNSKKAERREKELKCERKEKRHKRNANKGATKTIEDKKESKIFDSEPVKFTFGRDFNRTGSHQIKHLKVNTEVNKAKEKLKKVEKMKFKKSFLSKVKKDIYGRQKYNRPCSRNECYNSTGYWVFKWADGREEFRRHQKLGDWQFARAKGRKELRDEDYSTNWQFKRAVGRESNRNGGRWDRRKETRFNGKEFFHEGFSWI